MRLREIALLSLSGLLVGCSDYSDAPPPPPAAYAPAPPPPVVTEEPPPPLNGAPIYSPAPPPPPIAEVQFAPPSPDFVWIPGHYVWRGGYVWIRGHYAHRPHPYAHYHPGHWQNGPYGWFYVNGHF